MKHVHLLLVRNKSKAIKVINGCYSNVFALNVLTRTKKRRFWGYETGGVINMKGPVTLVIAYAAGQWTQEPLGSCHSLAFLGKRGPHPTAMMCC